jgi:hypothetical protein
MTEVAPAMIKRVVAFALLLSSCLLLSGCFEMRQEYWINADGSGRVLMDIGVVKIDAGKGAAAPQGESELEKNMREANERFSREPNVKSAKLSQEDRDGMRHLVLDVECRDITKFNETMRERARQARQSAAAQAPAGSQAGSADDSMTPVIEKLPNGDYAFRMSLERGRGNKSKPNPATDRLARQWVEKIFAGRYFTILLHAPKVSESNGQINATANLVEWKMPMTQFASDEAPFKELTARVVTPSVISPQRWLPEVSSASAGWGAKQYAVLGGAALLLAAAGVILLRSLRDAS